MLSIQTKRQTARSLKSSHAGLYIDSLGSAKDLQGFNEDSTTD